MTVKGLLLSRKKKHNSSDSNNSRDIPLTKRLEKNIWPALGQAVSKIKSQVNLQSNKENL